VAASGFYPGTRTGWWAVGLVIVFFVFLKFLFILGAQTGHDRGTFFSDPMMAFALLGTATSGIAAGAMALVAMRKRARSIIVFLAFLQGVFVLWFTIGALNGG
jgi:hypothetical protein